MTKADLQRLQHAQDALYNALKLLHQVRDKQDAQTQQDISNVFNGICNEYAALDAIVIKHRRLIYSKV